MRKLIILIILQLFFAHAAFAGQSCVHSPSEFSCVTYVRNYDADTITVNIPGVHPIIGNKISIRVAGIDSPELRTKDPCEKQLAYEARDYVKSLLTNAQRIDLKNLERGKYFRIVADVMVDKLSLANALLERGYAYPYEGGKKQDRDWCR